MTSPAPPARRSFRTRHCGFLRGFCRTERVVTIYSQGVNQSVSGSDKVNAILNCHLLTGRIGKPGCGPFSVTGQPNAMGGREVGGLANMLAAHMNIEDEAARNRVQRFWASPAMAAKPGLKAVDLFRPSAKARSRPCGSWARTPWIRCPMPMPWPRLSRLPLRGGLRCGARDRYQRSRPCAAARRRLGREKRHGDEFRTAHLAPAELPAAARRGEADWWIMSEVARRMGFAGFDFTHAAEIFREHAALSGFENGGTRDFDISAHAEFRSPNSRRSSPSSGRRPRARAPARRASSRMGISSRRSQRRGWCRRRCAPR